ncbi:MAG: hypothetical protein WA902_21825 [Thermosynechococcaceae cyanobacterium]
MQDFGVKTQKLQTWLGLDFLIYQYEASTTVALYSSAFEAWVSCSAAPWAQPSWVEQAIF